MSSEPILSIRHVSRRFSGLKAVDDVSLDVRSGEVLGLIGSNGAGKTTLVNVVSGHLRPSAGEIQFEGRSIGGYKPHQLARLGLMRTFQVVQPFMEISARENVASAVLFTRHARSRADALTQADITLDRLGIGHCKDHLPGRMTLAERKRLELARAYAAKPRLLFLDEVNAGLNSAEVDGVLEMIRSIANEGVAIVLIEHLMRVVRGLCSRLVVLHQGKLLADGPVEQIAQDPAVIEAYLGRRGAASFMGQTS